MTSSPWAKIQTLEQTASLDEIASEELAKSLQEREIQKHAATLIDKDNTEETQISDLDFEVDDTGSDEAIAHTLQAQFNQEFNSMLKRTEDKYNKNAKVNISYSNYRMSALAESEDTNATTEEKKDIDRFVSVEKEYASIPRCGYKKNGEGSEIVTKHDILMSSRINACRVLEFPPGISTGDTGGFDMKLNNKVFNSLRAHSHAHCSREKAKTRPHTK